MLSGSNYQANDSLRVRIDGITLRTSGTCTADASGTLPATNNCAFTVPNVSTGPHTVTVSDGTYYGTATFRVSDGTWNGTDSPAISVTPSAGPVPGSAAVSGSGFTPDSRIALTIDGSSVSTDCKTDADGRFSNCLFTAPAATAGLHTVGASDNSTDYASAFYTVQPAITLTPGAGAAGSTVTLSGTGFAALSPITKLTFDGTLLTTSGTCTADANGSLPASNNCAFTVPVASAGVHIVQATDGSRDNASASFRV
jgi:hypothetical protein